jgi:hypothetical protein
VIFFHVLHNLLHLEIFANIQLLQQSLVFVQPCCHVDFRWIGVTGMNNRPNTKDKKEQSMAECAEIVNLNRKLGGRSGIM